MDEVITPEPKKISPSKLMGTEPSALGNVGQGGESKTGKLARILRTTRVKVNDNEKKIKVNVDKLMGHDDEIEQVHETLFGVVEKQGELQAQQKKGDGTTEGIEALAANLDTIAKELTSINTLLGTQLKNQEKAAQQAATAARAEKRRKDEEKAERKPSKSETPKFKAPKPVVDFFDKIKNFFTQVLLGSAVLGIINWIKNPENKKKINDVVDFIADNTPIILGGLLAIVGIGIGAKLISFMSGLIGITTTLIGLLGPFGLKAILIAAGVLLAGIAIKKGREAILDYVGGVGFTSTGLAFGYEDIQNITDSKLRELERKVASGEMTREEAREAKKPYDRLRDLMRQRKKANDRLDIVTRNAQGNERRIKEARARGDDGEVKRQERYLAQALERKKELEEELVILNRKVTKQFDKTGITEQQIMSSVEGRGGEVARLPSAVDPSLRRSLIEARGNEYGADAMAAADLGAGAFQPSNPGIQHLNATLSGITNSMMPDKAGIQTPEFGASMRLNQAGVGEGFSLTEKMMEAPITDKETGFYKNKMVLDTKDIFSGKMTIEIPPPGSGEGVTIVGLDGKPVESGSGAVVTGNQSNFTPFSSYDPNNDSFASVMSIYNAL